MVEELGYKTIGADSGAKAVDIYKNHFEKIDLVVLDMAMPDKDGEAVFREMKKIDPNCKVMMLSANIRDVDTEKLTKLGIKAFLQKPIELESLDEEIKSIIGG